MDIKWGSLGQVFVVSLGATAALVVLFSLGVLAASARQDARDQGGAAAVPSAAAALCFAACAAIVAYGLYLIIPQFH